MHGAVLDIVTPDEIVRLIPRPEQITRIRATTQVTLNATGAGQDDVYKVPAGYEFAARRVTMYTSIADPVTGAVIFAAGKAVAYLRSGAFIEWAQPQFGNSYQVPGVQTWGSEQGPYLRNSEVFQVQAFGLTASAILTVILEGLLRRPPVDDGNAKG
jgi:hypothetical protein